MGRIVCCLMLNTEVWALRLQLQLGYGLYDRIIVTEARTTFAGAPKPLYFERYRDRFPDPAGKILHVVVDSLPAEPQTLYRTARGQLVQGNRWPAEHAMRNACRPAIAALRLGPEDLCVVQDVDEFVHPDALSRWARALGPRQVHRLVYHDYRQTVARGGRQAAPWHGGFAIRPALAAEDLHDLRRLHMRDGVPHHWHIQSPEFIAHPDGRPFYPLLRRPDLRLTRGQETGDPPGWHFSSMTGGFAKLQAHKRNAFAHAEFDTGAVRSEDYWAETEAFIAAAAARGAYRTDDLDPCLPAALRARIGEYPILLTPDPAP